MLKRSKQLFEKALQLFPGGVNSPVRAFRSVGGTPLFIDRAQGAYLVDADQNTYIDYVGSWGPAIAGHAHPKVVQAIQSAAERGSSFGAPSALEIQLAREVMARMPNLKRIRFVNSGTEAVMGAIRAARAYTGRSKILKFEGCYHGHADYLLVKAGSGALTHGQPDSLGVPPEFVEHTLVVPFNDLAAVQKLVKQQGRDLAAIIVEPIVGNMGLVLPQAKFLQALRKLTRESKSLLIFDEVMTGFRVHSGGAQALYEIQPDLTTLGKIIGGGLPVGAYGGSEKVMKMVSPEGGAYQAGTLSGNPLAMAAGLATLKLLNPQSYTRLYRRTQKLAQGIQEAGESIGVALQVPFVCGMFSIFFSKQPILNLADVQSSQVELFKKFFHEMLKRGIYLPPSPYEACFVSLAHGENEIAKTLRAAKDSLKQLVF